MKHENLAARERERERGYLLKENKTVGPDASVRPNSTTEYNIGVGADAPVCPNATKTNPNNRRGMGYRAQEPAAITLVALIITVIILIILAGVSLNLALGQNGIFQKSKEAVDKYTIASEREYLEQNILLYQMHETTNDNSIKKLGEELTTQNLYNGENWNMVFTDKKEYGTNWNYIAKGTKTEDYGEIKYNWVVNYKTKEIVQLEEGKYDKLDYKDSVAVTDNLPLNIDASNLKNGNWDGITKRGDVTYNEEKMALKFDGDGDYLELKKEDADFSKGFTFEIFRQIKI